MLLKPVHWVLDAARLAGRGGAGPRATLDRKDRRKYKHFARYFKNALQFKNIVSLEIVQYLFLGGILD